MALPGQPVTLSVQQIQDLSQHFSAFRHDVNNSVGLISAAAELMRYSPDAAKKWSVTLIEQPPRIAGKTREFLGEAERVLGIRGSTQASWYRDLWSRFNAPAAAPDGAIQLSPAEVEALHQEMLNMHKELTHLGFMVSGADAIASYGSPSAREGASAAAEQLGKVTRKFDQFATLFEKNFRVSSVPHRLLTGVPLNSVTLSPDEIGLFHRRLNNLERDVNEHLAPLLDLSKFARAAPEQLQSRAAELAPHAPKIATLIQQFGTEFDKTLGLHRGV
jgi:hypothetical protein